ncbi:hypothetical protein BY458DRAFT_528465 [Sporodiniella umbellata]|nr:hypothetical protein BY458DRAFT_528465 [Sporodiniella umbellata]
MRIWVLAGLFIFLLLMGLLGFTPIQLNINDKLLHFTVFFILSFFLYFLWNMSIKRNLILGITSFVFIASGSELIQGTLPYRTFDMYDILANMSGIVGFPVSYWIDSQNKIVYEPVTDEMRMDTVY